MFHTGSQRSPVECSSSAHSDHFSFPISLPHSPTGVFGITSQVKHSNPCPSSGGTETMRVMIMITFLVIANIRGMLTTCHPLCHMLCRHFSHLTLRRAQSCRHYYPHPHFTDEELRLRELNLHKVIQLLIVTPRIRTPIAVTPESEDITFLPHCLLAFLFCCL